MLSRCQLRRRNKVRVGMLTKDLAQLLVSAVAPFVAAGAALTWNACKWASAVVRRDRLWKDWNWWISAWPLLGRRKR